MPALSLGGRIVLVSLFTGLVIAVVIAIGLLIRSYEDDRALAEQRVEEMTQTMVPGLEASVWFVDSGQTRTLLDGIARVPGVDYVLLRTTDGEVLTHGAPVADPLFTRTIPLKWRDGSRYDLGTLTVVVGHGWITERLHTRAVSPATVSVLVLLGTSLIFSLLFRLLVTRHLGAMADYSARFGIDRLDVPLALASRPRRDPPDDLDVVVDALNGMRERIAEFVRLRAAYEEALVEHRDRLEELVLERTAELEEKARLLTIAHDAESMARRSAADSAARFADFAGVAADGFWETDAALRLIYVSPMFAQTLGLQVDDMLGRTPEDIYRRLFPGGGDASSYLDPMRRQEAFDGQVLYAVDRRGQRRWLVNQGRPVHDDAGAFLGYRGAVRDVTAQRLAEKALKDSETRLRAIADNIPALVSQIDADRRYRFNNKAYGQLLDRPLDEITGRRVDEVLPPDALSVAEPHIDHALAGESATFELAIGERMFRVSYVPEPGPDGRISGVYESAHDITRAKQLERELRELAQFDPLTGLANRRRYDERLREAIARSERGGETMALMFLDLDHFKRINDTWGHEGGDRLLVEFARRLQTCVRRTDTVARIAGDEFVIILEGLHVPAEAATVAAKIVDAMRPPVRVGEGEVVASTTIGIAVRAQGEIDPAALLRRADAALYAAKAQGRGRYLVAPAA